MKHIIIMLIAIISFVTAGCSEQTTEEVQVQPLNAEEFVDFLPAPESHEDYTAQAEALLADDQVSVEAYVLYTEEYEDEYGAQDSTPTADIDTEFLDMIAEFVEKGGVSMVTRIKVDPAAYAGLMTAAAAPEGTDLETGVQFDPEGDQVLINYGQPGRAPAVTVTYPITGMIEQMGQIMSQFDPEIGEEIPEAVAEWQATRQDIVERLAQQ